MDYRQTADRVCAVGCGVLFSSNSTTVQVALLHLSFLAIFRYCSIFLADSWDSPTFPNLGIPPTSRRLRSFGRRIAQRIAGVPLLPHQSRLKLQQHELKNRKRQTMMMMSEPVRPLLKEVFHTGGSVSVTIL